MESVGQYLGTLMESRNQAHIFHLQTNSYSQHKALKKYYEEIVDLLDTYAEAYQGKYGVIMEYQMTTPLIQDVSKVDMYFDGLCMFCDKISNQLPDDSFLVNVEDEIKTLVNKTKYLLSLS